MRSRTKTQFCFLWRNKNGVKKFKYKPMRKKIRVKCLYNPIIGSSANNWAVKNHTLKPSFITNHEVQQTVMTFSFFQHTTFFICQIQYYIYTSLIIGKTCLLLLLLLLHHPLLDTERSPIVVVVVVQWNRENQNVQELPLLLLLLLILPLLPLLLLVERMKWRRTSTSHRVVQNR